MPPSPRREFIRNCSFAAAAATAPFALTRAQEQAQPTNPPFKLHYAPHPGMFKNLAGDDLIDQIKFAADQGFTAWEDNGLPSRSEAIQEKVGSTLVDLNMEMGVFVAYASFDQPTFTNPNSDATDHILDRIRESVTIAKRVGAKYFTVVPGSIDQQHNEKENWNRYGGARLSSGYQDANAIDLLRRCSELLEPHDLTMVLEPLNWHADHGGTFLRYSDHAYAICKAVNSPSCKILFDIYHQQISEGNLIPNIDHCWSEIAYFQAGDNPGRKEPGTGEINYRNVFRHIHSRSKKEGRSFIIGMEHGNSLSGGSGEEAVIQAYREADSY